MTTKTDEKAGTWGDALCRKFSQWTQIDFSTYNTHMQTQKFLGKGIFRVKSLNTWYLKVKKVNVLEEKV